MTDRALAGQPVAWMDRAKFEALRKKSEAGGAVVVDGVLTMVTNHRAFPDDVPLYLGPPSSRLQQAVERIEKARALIGSEEQTVGNYSAGRELEEVVTALRAHMKGQP